MGELVEAGVEAILYAGGTNTRDIVNALEAAGPEAQTIVSSVSRAA